MNKRIKLILALTMLCVAGLIFLQGYWNYSAYHQAKKSFRTDINTALQQAIDSEIEMQHQQVLKKYTAWLNDTSLILVGTMYHKFKNNTSFTIADRYPPFNDGRKPFNIGLGSLGHNKKIDSITPTVKKKFIELFVDGVIKEDLKKRAAGYYTQRLGDSLALLLEKSRVSLPELAKFYSRALSTYGIGAKFRIDTGVHLHSNNNGLLFKTKLLKAGITLNTDLAAAFESPELVVLTRMKWVLLGSLLLVTITIFCFGYTASTLLSQEKLGLMKDDFVNNMTHELKTPVATIAVAAEAIETFNLSKETSHDYIGIIRHQAENLSYLIDKILSNAVKEESRLVLALEKIHLPSFIEGCHSQYQPQLQMNNATLDFVTNGIEPYIMGDAVHLTNVFTNLLDNAVKYGSQPTKINISALTIDNYVVLNFANTGKPISPDHRDRIFERFFRVIDGNTHNVKGHGLGLTYVAQILQKHGGSISLVTEEFANVFSIKLPIAK